MLEKGKKYTTHSKFHIKDVNVNVHLRQCYWRASKRTSNSDALGLHGR